jgi:nitroreductase
MKTLQIIAAAVGLATAISCCQNNEACQQNAAQPQENGTIETIMSRRSIRKYKQIPVSRDTLDIILECGINAPNGQNRQSWEVRVVDNPAVMEEIKEMMAAGNSDMKAEAVKGCFRDAPVMVFLARDPSYPFSAYDVGLLSENIMLSAWSMGVGSICLGMPVRFIQNNEACAPVLERLGFSDGYEFCLCIGLGYADEAPAAKSRDKTKVKFIE